MGGWFGVNAYSAHSVSMIDRMSLGSNIIDGGINVKTVQQCVKIVVP